MSEHEGAARGRRRGVGLRAIALLLSGFLRISTAYGMLLLLPLYVRELGGDEAAFGVIFSSATRTAVLCLGLLIRYPEALKPHARALVDLCQPDPRHPKRQDQANGYLQRL